MGSIAQRFAKQPNHAPQTDRGHKEDYTPLSDLPSREPLTATAKKRAFTPIHELIANRKCISWVIRDYLPLESTCCLYGESGAGKSFLMLDMALHIAMGKEWQGHKTKRGGVFYVAGEGVTGITARCQAWALHHGVGLDSALFFCSDGALKPQIDTDSSRLMLDVKAWIESTGAKPMMIVFDTLARCFVGNENDADATGNYIDAVDSLKQHFQCCVVSVHHSGKDPIKGGRGSSALKGAWDMEHALSVQGDIKRLETTKAKDIKEPDDKYFRLESVDTGWIDDDDEPVTSAVMIGADLSDSDKVKGKAKPLSERNRSVLSELPTAIEKHGIEPTSGIKALFPDSPHNCPTKVVHGDKWRDLAYAVIDATNKAKAFTDCKNQLRAAGKVGFYDGYFWII